MTKRVPQPVVDSKNAALIIDKEKFKEELNKQIEVGNGLYAETIRNIEEFKKNEADYRKWDDYNSELLKQSFNIERSDYKYDYDHCASWVGVAGAMILSPTKPSDSLRDLKEKIKRKVDNLEKLRDKTNLLKCEVSNYAPPSLPESNNYSSKLATPDNNHVFIVHGHSDTIKVNVARTLEKLGLVPVILHEKPNEGKTIIEKFEKHSNVGFAVVLLTDDDEGKSKSEKDFHKRARQNVLLELGYFIGRLGRERVVPLYSKAVELPSDLYGLVYVPIDAAESWKYILVRELKAAGYDVDANKII